MNIKNKTRITYPVLILSLIFILFCTSPIMAGQLQLGCGYGVNYFKMDNLNSYLNNAGFNSVNSYFRKYTISISGLILNERLFIGFNMIDFFSNNTGNNKGEIYIDGEYFCYELGYRVITSKYYSLLPILGIGRGGIKIDIVPQSSTSLDINNILTDPKRSASLKNYSTLLELSLQNTFSIIRKETSKMSVALKAGVMYNMNNKLKMNGTNLSGNTILPKESYFIDLMIIIGFDICSKPNK